MKKLYTLILFLVFAHVSIAQNVCNNAVLIGNTNIHVQSNDGCTGRLIYEWPDQTISAVWMLSHQNTPYFDRGTGYNYFNGIWNVPPAARIESVRTGFPNITGRPSGEEILICHESQNAFSNFRNPHGTGPWVENPIPSIPLIWNKIAAGGTPGQLHLVGNSPYYADGQECPMRYWRSPDNGVTWDIQDYSIPFLDSSSTLMTHPSKNIASRGNVVAIVTGGWSDNLILCKSIDNGVTWTQTIINAFPISLYFEDSMITDINNDGIADTIFTVDGSNSLVIDSNNNVHVWAGKVKVVDPVLWSGFGFFLQESGLVYWNETMPPNSILNNVIAEPEDLNANGVLTFSSNFNGEQCGAASMASAGINSMDHLFVTYTALMEDTLIPLPSIDFSRYNLYATKSEDNGQTWTTPFRICPDDFADQIFPSMAEIVYNDPKIIFLKDTTTIGFPPSPKDIMFISPVFTTGIFQADIGNIQFNAWQPVNEQSILIEIKSDVSLKDVIVDVIDLSGRSVKVHKILNNLPDFTEKIQLNSLNSGLYFVRLNSKSVTTVRKLFFHAGN